MSVVQLNITSSPAANIATATVEKAVVNIFPQQKMQVIVTQQQPVNLLMQTMQKPTIVFTGATALNGASAYEIAVAKGFVGTEEQWLNSIKSLDGGIIF